MNDTNPTGVKADAQRIRAGLERLTHILGRLAPTRAFAPSLYGTPPELIGMNYCWAFEGGGPDLYQFVQRAIGDFRGRMRWSYNAQFNEKGACITALAENDIAGANRSLIEEIEELCRFIESRLEGREHLLSDTNASVIEFQAEHTLWGVMLVRHVKKFRWPAPTSEVDQTLDVGLTYDEWYALFFQVLGKSEDQSDVHPIEFEGEIEGYPILSRLNDIHDVASVDETEIADLKNECLGLTAKAKDNAAAQLCVEKLLRICRRAEGLKTGIIFTGD